MPSALRLNLGAPGALEFRSQLRILQVLEPGPTGSNRPHVSATLHIVLPAQRIHAAAISPDVSCKQRQVDQCHHVVHCIVMFRNPERPANLAALSLRVSMRRLPNRFRWHTGLALRSVQRVFLHALAVSLKSTRRVPDEGLIGQTGYDDLPTHGVGQRNVTSHVKPQPHIRPLRRTRAPRIHHVQFRSVANPLEDVMKKDRVCLAGVRTPQQDYLALFDFAVRARSPTGSEYRRQTGDAGRVSSSVATVDVVGTDHRPHKLLCHVITFIGGLRTTEHPKRPRAMFLDLPSKPCGNPVQSLVPTRRAMLPILANLWRRQSFLPRVAHTRLS